MKEARTKYGSIDEYISAFPQNIQQILQEMREAILEVVPDAQEAISYGIPTFKLNGNLVHFAAFTHHIGFYPGGPSAIEAFSSELGSYEVSKGTIRFPLDRAIPLDLVKRIVKFRVVENKERGKK